ncbi:hypothetical protein M5D96_009463 [Drosophila gunungcola]|uniref:Uncharacterized protein n=1 Tax=Drosophila gunungcola TaxID=103775 RepID=A0A9P9YIL9_9MUSC|nr:hypothetical protein M5D96_009463 [Drosophila gunungcola]
MKTTSSVNLHIECDLHLRLKFPVQLCLDSYSHHLMPTITLPAIS